MTPKNLLRGFKRPNKINLEHDELQSNYGRFIAEPFERGYGLTIGNSLRRVLLSSIEGTAITAIKIEGISHEFSSIEGIYEDVPRIILNLKRLCFRYDGEMPKVLHIVKKGPGNLTGEDFNNDPDVEVMTKDLVVCQLNEAAEIDMEVQIERGRGYVPAEMNKSNTETIGVIPVDSIFSPIKKVNVKIEDTRVGQRTDYDKLILEIWTDGSISPDNALAYAAKIIKEHMTIFINFEEKIEEEIEEVDENLEKMRLLLGKSIDEIEFSVRSYNTLKTQDVSTFEQLVRKTEDELKKSKHYSEAVLKEIKTKLESLHLSLGLKD
ncbi:MAG: DNA-directed RNA polymerase subunit alpha [Leptospirales bacterium]|nr:DNA-directed RNA polymerase subunit alpha [Leptospirales bacterium]